MGSFHQYSQEHYQIFPLDMVGNVLISSLISLAKSDLYHTKKLLMLV